jgi:hypothetical protein
MPTAGWYKDPSDPAQMRWFDGDAWTARTSSPEAVLPLPVGDPIGASPIAGEPTPKQDERPCDYCLQPVPSQAVRCNHCAGEFRQCPTCRRKVGLTTTKKPVTLVFRKTNLLCMHCGRKLGESRVDA